MPRVIFSLVCAGPVCNAGTYYAYSASGDCKIHRSAILASKYVMLSLNPLAWRCPDQGTKKGNVLSIFCLPCTSESSKQLPIVPNRVWIKDKRVHVLLVTKLLFGFRILSRRIDARPPLQRGNILDRNGFVHARACACTHARTHKYCSRSAPLVWVAENIMLIGLRKPAVASKCLAYF